MYQTVRFINDKEEHFDKYLEIKSLRAQLTTHEQALLFINSLTPIGSAWWEDGLITKYRFVQNIPHGFFDPEKEIDLPSYFPQEYFEYQEGIVQEKDVITQPD